MINRHIFVRAPYGVLYCPAYFPGVPPSGPKGCPIITYLLVTGYKVRGTNYDMPSTMANGTILHECITLPYILYILDLVCVL